LIGLAIFRVAIRKLSRGTGFEEMNGRFLRAEIRERKGNSPEALSSFRAVVFSGSELRYESLLRLQKSKVVLPVVLAGPESSPINQGVCPNLGQRILTLL
jgi:hypothetical protein